jgi:hypothetical protein
METYEAPNLIMPEPVASPKRVMKVKPKVEEEK